MPTDRMIDEMIARCVSVMVCHHNMKQCPETTGRMREEVRTIARAVASWRLDVDESSVILPSVRHELRVRYGRETGYRIYAEFADAFESILADCA